MSDLTLKERSERAIGFFSPMTTYTPDPRYTMTPEEIDWVRKIIEDQQAEIQRLQEKIDMSEQKIKEYHDRLEYFLFACDEHGKECEEYLAKSKDERKENR
jgi:DNA repair ATPase RecN